MFPEPVADADLGPLFAKLPRPKTEREECLEILAEALRISDNTAAILKQNEELAAMLSRFAETATGQIPPDVSERDVEILAIFAYKGPHGPPMPPPPTFVYFGRRPDGVIKIGVSGDPTRRVRGMRTDSGVVITLLACMTGTREDETALHARFAATRVLGEWFKPTEELLALIAATRTTYGDPGQFVRSVHAEYATDHKRWETEDAIWRAQHREEIEAAKAAARERVREQLRHPRTIEEVMASRQDRKRHK